MICCRSVIGDIPIFEWCKCLLHFRIMRCECSTMQHVRQCSMHWIIYQQGHEKDRFMWWTWQHESRDWQEEQESTKKDSKESRVSTTGYNTLPPCNQHKDTSTYSRITSELPLCDKVCRMEILSPKKEKQGKGGYGMAHPLEVWSSGFSHGEKDTHKRGDLMYILHVWDTQLVRPIKKRKKR